MSMQMRLELRLSQQLVMTPQLQMAIKLLQLSRMELVDMVREEMLENPVLEEADCAAVVKGMGYHFDSRFLRETPARRILERMLNNLIGIFRREGDEERSRQLHRYREIVQSG